MARAWDDMKWYGEGTRSRISAVPFILATAPKSQNRKITRQVQVWVCKAPNHPFCTCFFCNKRGRTVSANCKFISDLWEAADEHP